MTTSLEENAIEEKTTEERTREERSVKDRHSRREWRGVTLGLSALALTSLIGAPLRAQDQQGGQTQAQAQAQAQAQVGLHGSHTRAANPVVQRLIENSSLHFLAGEESFKDGNFDRARREYDRAIDIILESGLDVRTDAHLRQHYETIVENIFQRQMTLLVMAPTSVDPEGDSGRGFGTQAFSPSPLDELARIDLTTEETKGATAEQARESVVAAHLDFGFKPNALIQSYINYYQGRGRGTMEQGLRRSGRFMAMSRKIFKEEGVPQDLVWLCQVESAWLPNARSWAAAVGLWQFIAGTGTRFGLQIDSWVDERSSFEKATRASARYLRFLADRYDGNWELAMAAYNTGEGRIDAAIAKSGYADFWEIYERGLIPRETRNYVPNILATIIIAKNPQRFGFAVDPEPSLTYDYVKVNNLVDLKLVADATDASPDLIEALNPELKRGVTPPSSEYLLRVPAGKGRELQRALARIPVEKRASWRMMTANAGDNFETIARRTGLSADLLEEVNGGTIPTDRKIVVPVNGRVRNVVLTSARNDNDDEEQPVRRGAASKRDGATSARSGKVITYRVRRGETLGDIAGKYNTSVGALTTLNGIGRGSRLRIGQALKVPVR